ncbi:MAG TPA: ABC transporter ATP-binding protein [Gemmataceae bacterium]|nr:ABC transporter ATP-binding protein [Gemmataceae bacterium]
MGETVANQGDGGLALDGLRFAYGSTPALQDVGLRVAPGKFFSLLGPSGSGKTTLLRLVGGYLTPSQGSIHVGGRDVTSLPPERRNIGMVFQNYALFPHLTARANVAFGLEMQRVSRDERETRVEVMLDRVGLSAAERDRRPARLSGGQQQRVALARALVIEPALLLLDEPLANLDRPLREQMRGELKALQRRTGVTTLLVTHDREEALLLADQVGILCKGRLLQVGDPRTVYRQPTYPFVARLLGDANLLPIESVQSEAACLGSGLRLKVAPDGQSRFVPGRLLLLRPEDCQLADGPGSNRWSGRVMASQFLGPDQIVFVEVADGVALRVRLRAGQPAPRPGEAIAVYVPPEAAWPIPEPDPAEAADVVS